MSDSLAKKNCAKSLSAIEKSNIPENIKENNDIRYLSTSTELLMEFLTSIMSKDYEQALMYCTEILRLEPQNTTALEFYPLIVNKLEMMDSDTSESSSSSSSDSSLNSSSSENIFFNNTSKPVLKKQKEPEKERSERHDEGKKNNTEIEMSSSVPMEKIINKDNIKDSESVSYQNEGLKTAHIDAPVPNNLLVHPTQTISLIRSKVADIKINCSKSKEKENVTGNKCSQVLLHKSSTVTIHKENSPVDFKRT